MNRNTNKVVLNAVVGVWFKQGRTYYVRRSPMMKNYPNVWSLFSIQFTPPLFDEPSDIQTVTGLFHKMAQERLLGSPLKVIKHLSSDDSDKNPIDSHVYLHLYELDFDQEPALNPDFYSQARWMNFDEYREATKQIQCGLCTRMWEDYAYWHRLAQSASAHPIACLPTSQF